MEIPPKKLMVAGDRVLITPEEMDEVSKKNVQGYVPTRA